MLVLKICANHRVRIVRNELGGSALQQELRGWGSQWNERGTGGLINSNPASHTIAI